MPAEIVCDWCGRTFQRPARNGPAPGTCSDDCRQKRWLFRKAVEALRPWTDDPAAARAVIDSFPAMGRKRDEDAEQRPTEAGRC